VGGAGLAGEDRGGLGFLLGGPLMHELLVLIGFEACQGEVVDDLELLGQDGLIGLGLFLADPADMAGILAGDIDRAAKAVLEGISGWAGAVHGKGLSAGEAGSGRGSHRRDPQTGILSAECGYAVEWWMKIIGIVHAF